VAEAVAAGLAEVPELLLLDVTLPDGEGLEVLERLRAAGRLPRVTVALTGHDDEALAARCRAAGCRDVLLKPVPIRVLLAKTSEWLAG
jgi:CheY-like chemotaxis protein